MTPRDHGAPVRAGVRLLTLPAHAVAAVAGVAAGVASGVASTMLRRAGRLAARTAGRVSATATPSGPWPIPDHDAAPLVEVPDAARPRTTGTRRAPSAQAAVLAPALGLSEAEVEAVAGGEGPASDRSADDGR